MQVVCLLFIFMKMYSEQKLFRYKLSYNTAYARKLALGSYLVIAIYIGREVSLPPITISYIYEMHMPSFNPLQPFVVELRAVWR